MKILLRLFKAKLIMYFTKYKDYYFNISSLFIDCWYKLLNKRLRLDLCAFIRIYASSSGSMRFRLYLSLYIEG